MDLYGTLTGCKEKGFPLNSRIMIVTVTTFPILWGWTGIGSLKWVYLWDYKSAHKNFTDNDPVTMFPMIHGDSFISGACHLKVQQNRCFAFIWHIAWWGNRDIPSDSWSGVWRFKSAIRYSKDLSSVFPNYDVYALCPGLILDVGVWFYVLAEVLIGSWERLT